MSGILPLFLFTFALVLLLLINLYNLQENSATNQRLERSILDGVRSIRCPSVTTCEPCSSVPNVLKLPEMTKILNARNTQREAIFFTETSGKGTIKPRFMCAVESAAKAYLYADVYLLVAYSTDELNLDKNEALRHVLKYHRNIRVLYVDLDILFAGTPLEDFHKSGKLNATKYKAGHTSDIVRFLTLWLYGGKYFDLDIITIRNLTGLNNFIIDESQLPNNYIANGAFAYEKHSPVGSYIFNIINKSFDTVEWTANGPRVITEAMKWYTGVSLAAQMNSTNLKEFTKLRYEQLFPIEYFDLLLYFDKTKKEEAISKIKKVKDLFGVHIGNNLMKHDSVVVGSDVAYSWLAQKYCPRSYWSAHAVF